MRQSQIEPDLIQVGVRGPHMFLAGGSTLTDGIEQRFLKIERGLHQTLSGRMAVDLRKLFRFREQPRQEIERSR